MYKHYHINDGWYDDCEGCWADTITPRVVDNIDLPNRLAEPVGTNVIFDLEDSDISNPPEEVTWYPINHPNASWNNPK